jgi:hypothetical protein
MLLDAGRCGGGRQEYLSRAVLQLFSMIDFGLLRDVPELPTDDIRFKMLEGSRAFLQSSSFTTLYFPPPNQVLGVCLNKEADGRARGSPFLFTQTPEFNAVTLNTAGRIDEGGVRDDEELVVSAVDDRLKRLEWGRLLLLSSRFDASSWGIC